MPRRSVAGLDQVASLPTLTWAFWRAAKGRRRQAEVQAFEGDLDARLAGLARAIREGQAPDGRYTSFTIHDPKRRRILAPCFADRVLHHALMAHVGPVLERGLVDDTYACRVGRGCLAAVDRAQQHLRRFPWYVKADVRSYFASIDRAHLSALLRRRFKDPGLLALFARILARAPVPPGRGLPIGALTSQHFANVYLDVVDRHLLERLRVRGMVRYMDDMVWWTDSRQQARETLAEVRQLAWEARGLEIKEDASIGRSARGLSFLGYRILPGTRRLLLRRRRRYRAAVARWEGACERGEVDALTLQANITAAGAILAHANANAWRRGLHARRPELDV